MEQIRDVDGPRFGWREAGDGPVIVLLHGLGGSRLSWEPQLAGLSDSYRVVAWDLPGYGASPPLSGTVTFAALSDAVAALADDLGAEQIHLVGLSFGGMIAQYAAAAHPERIASLTLMATSPKFGLDGTRPDQWRAARLAPLDAGQEPIDFADVVLRSLAGPTITADALAGQRSAMARISAAALRTSIDCLITHDSRSILSAISAPTQCLVGELDDETPLAYTQYLVDHIPGANLVLIAGGGHLLNVERPIEVNAAIRAHTSRSIGSRAASGESGPAENQSVRSR